MPPNLDALWTLVDQLHAEAEYVTFYDALALVRAARSFENLPDGLIADWVSLHDTAHVTDGARAIFGQYLRRYRRRQQQQRSLATQLIVLKDSGKSLRAAVGQPIAVALEARPAHGWVWHWEGGPQCLHYDAMPQHSSPHERGLTSRYVLTPLCQGSGMCRWAEAQSAAPPAVMPARRNQKTRPPAPSARRTFELFVIVEGS